MNEWTFVTLASRQAFEDLNKSSKIHYTVTVVFLHWQQALHIFKASDVTPFICKYRNIAPSQREITFLFSYLCGLPMPLFHLSERRTDSRLECSSLTNRSNDLQTSYLTVKFWKMLSSKGKRQLLAHLGGNFWFIVFLYKVMAFQSCQKLPREHCLSA